MGKRVEKEEGRRDSRSTYPNVPNVPNVPTRSPCEFAPWQDWVACWAAINVVSIGWRGYFDFCQTPGPNTHGWDFLLSSQKLRCRFLHERARCIIDNSTTISKKLRGRVVGPPYWRRPRRFCCAAGLHLVAGRFRKAGVKWRRRMACRHTSTDGSRIRMPRISRLWGRLAWQDRVWALLFTSNQPPAA